MQAISARRIFSVRVVCARLQLYFEMEAAGEKEGGISVSERRAAVSRRLKTIHDMLKNVETQLFKHETIYLKSTYAYGNIVKGWDGYIDAKIKREKRKERKVRDVERIFSSAGAKLDPHATASSMISPRKQPGGGKQGNASESPATREARAAKRRGASTPTMLLSKDDPLVASAPQDDGAQANAAANKKRKLDHADGA